MNQSTCNVDGCERPRLSLGMCNMHYLRLRRHGSPQVVKGRGGRDPDSPGALCRVLDCGHFARARGWCAAHYSQWRRKGKVGAIATRESCETCGSRFDAPSRSRKFCSDSCEQIMRRSGPRPSSVACNLCGVETDLSVRRPSGRLQQSNITLCPQCRRRKSRRHGASRSLLAARDGTDCQLCGDAIDMRLDHPHPLSASVDHVIPYSLSGTHDLENLQLAHLICNLRKGNRLDS